MIKINTYEDVLDAVSARIPLDELLGSNSHIDHAVLEDAYRAAQVLLWTDFKLRGI